VSNSAPAPKPAKIGRAIFSSALKNVNKDRFVLLYPMIGFVATTGFAALLLIPIVSTFPIWVNDDNLMGIEMIAFVILTSVFGGFTHVLAQAGVMASANLRYSGQTPTFTSSSKEAKANLKNLALFGLLEASVGLVLRALRDNLKAAGDLLSFIGGFAWAVASYFAIPAILFEGLGPIASIRRSTEIIKAKWGSALRVNLFANFAFIVAIFIAFGVLMSGMYLFASAATGTLAEMFLGIWVVLGGLALLWLVILVQSTVMSYACVALYRYAQNQTSDGFDATLLPNAFKLKQQKFVGLKS